MTKQSKFSDDDLRARPKSFNRELEDVRAFHRRFGQLDSARPTHLTRRKLAERANFMLEELREFADGAGLAPLFTLDDEGYRFVVNRVKADQDLALQADALVDLVYVALGTAAMMGLPWQALWDDVQRANMAKEKGPTHRNMGFGSDICKPPGWEPPRTEEILSAAGYERVDFCSGDNVDDEYCLDDEGVKS